MSEMPGHINWDRFHEIKDELDSKYAEIERIKRNIQSLNRIIDRQYYVFNNMSRGQGKDRLYQEIQGYKAERSSEYEAIKELREEIKYLKQERDDLFR